MAHKVKLLHKEFKTKREAQQFFTEMLNRYKDGEKVLSKDDYHMLFDLIQRHPEVKEKVGIGIDYFYREKSADHNTRCFHIKRMNGTSTDFSIKTCINNANPTLQHNFYLACRTAVTPKLEKKKKEIFMEGEVYCSKSGLLVTIKNSKYRHDKPLFREIVDNFISSENLTITNDMIVKNKDMQYKTSFKDKELSDKFNTFHSKYANLKIVKNL